MRVVRGLTSRPAWSRCSVAIGTFDGLHLGHQALIRTAVETARAHGDHAVVLTFEPHPLELLSPGRAPLLLTLPDQREALMRDMGVTDLLIAEFDARMRDMAAADFVSSVLVNTLRARTVCVGEGFAYGRGREGSTATLASASRTQSFDLRVVPTVVVDGDTASSSRVRALLDCGNVEGAACVLGRPYAVPGIVERGEAVGRALGFPTANLRTDPRQLLPSDGVYATVVASGRRVHAGACSIGDRPTVGGTRRVFEVYLLGFDGDLYDSQLEVRFVARLRGQQRYGSLDDLVVQMRKDVEETRRIAQPLLAAGV